MGVLASNERLERVTEREAGRECVIDDGEDLHHDAAQSSGASTSVIRPVFAPRRTTYRVTSSS
jgi:hypothetical protein